MEAGSTAIPAEERLDLVFSPNRWDISLECVRHLEAVGHEPVVKEPVRDQELGAHDQQVE